MDFHGWVSKYRGWPAGTVEGVLRRFVDGTNSLRVGLITQWYEPETGAAAHPTAIARALAARGHEVKVLTAFPSYPGSALYPGYRLRFRQDEVLDGALVRRIPDVPSHDDSAVRRALSLTSFAVSATAQVRWLRNCDVVLTYLSPATVGVASWMLQRTAGVPYVLYVQDLWPETIAASGFISNERVERAVEFVVHRCLRQLYARADGVVALSPSMAKALAVRGTRTAPVSIPNWVDEGIFSPAGPAEVPELDLEHIWFMYAGGIGELQSLEHAVLALTHLRDRPEIGLAFVGDGVARASLERLVAHHGLLRRVRFLGPRPLADMPGLIARSAAQLVSLRDLPLFRTTVPSKLQASMACGAPVVCAVAGDAAEITTRSGGGLVVTPESASSIAAGFRFLADVGSEERSRMGQRGLKYYRTFLSAQAGALALEKVLENAMWKGDA